MSQPQPISNRPGATSARLSALKSLLQDCLDQAAQLAGRMKAEI